MPGFLFSLSVHEAAHAYAAHKLGDDTAKNLGRMTLNPLAHADPVGTILFPIAGILGLFGRFFFGWGKPVPVNYRNFMNPKRDAMIVSVAGPLSNLIVAVGFAGIIHGLFYFSEALVAGGMPIVVFKTLVETLIMYMFLNLALCFFNLIPIHPLDGGKILFGLLPDRTAYKFDMFMARYGFVILLALIFTNGIRYVLWPPIAFLGGILLGR
jgi:Zn-dependent protease